METRNNEVHILGGFIQMKYYNFRFYNNKGLNTRTVVWSVLDVVS